jgi:hypothetical protein
VNERRLMHEIAGNGQERHYFKRASVFTQAGGYYVCECGAEADRFGNLLEAS